jgi:hypothetical protein
VLNAAGRQVLSENATMPPKSVEFGFHSGRSPRQDRDTLLILVDMITVPQIGISGSAPASKRDRIRFSLDSGVEPLPPLRLTWGGLALDRRVFSNRR